MKRQKRKIERKKDSELRKKGFKEKEVHQPFIGQIPCE